MVSIGEGEAYSMEYAPACGSGGCDGDGWMGGHVLLSSTLAS